MNGSCGRDGVGGLSSRVQNEQTHAHWGVINAHCARLIIVHNLHRNAEVPDRSSAGAW